MIDITVEQIEAVSGGNAQDTTYGSFVGTNGVNCANSIMAWSGMGSLLGSGGGLIGGLGGFAIGGGLAARYSTNCNRLYQ